MDETEKVLALVDELSSPESMSKRVYADFLEDLIGNLADRLNAVKDELEEEG